MKRKMQVNVSDCSQSTAFLSAPSEAWNPVAVSVSAFYSAKKQTTKSTSASLEEKNVSSKQYHKLRIQRLEDKQHTCLKIQLFSSLEFEVLNVFEFAS